MRLRLTFSSGTVALAALLASVLTAAPASAGYVVDFGGSNAPSIGVGQTVDMPVYISFDGTGTDLLASENLAGVGVVLSYNLPPRSAPVPAQLTAITPTSAVNDADDLIVTSIVPATDSTAGTGTLSFVTVLSPPLAPEVGISPSRIYLGSFTFTGLAFGVSHLSLGLATPGDQFVTGALPNPSVLDRQITFGTGTVTVVPEPSSLSLIAVAFGVQGLALAVRRGKLRTPR